MRASRLLLLVLAIGMSAFGLGCPGAEGLGVGGAPACTSAPKSCPASVPSYKAEVAQIIALNCATCHVAGGSAPDRVMTTYADMLRYAGASLDEIEGCQMPPPSDAGPSSLGESDRQTLLTWLVCGAPDN